MVRRAAAMAVVCAVAAAARGFGEVAWGAALPRDQGSAVRTCPGATKVCLAAV